MTYQTNESEGFFASFSNISRSVRALVKCRLELFLMEVQREKLRVFETFLWLAVALALSIMGLIFGSVTLILWIWEVARFSGMLIMTGLFLSLSALLLCRIRNRIAKTEPPFSETISQLKKDRECLTAQN
jgi:uncharacterized membrane protein YqjE